MRAQQQAAGLPAPVCEFYFENRWTSKALVSAPNRGFSSQNFRVESLCVEVVTILLLNVVAKIRSRSLACWGNRTADKHLLDRAGDRKRIVIILKRKMIPPRMRARNQKEQRPKPRADQMTSDPLIRDSNNPCSPDNRPSRKNNPRGQSYPKASRPNNRTT